MTELRITRVNKSKFQIKDGKKVVRDNLKSFKEAVNTMINLDLEMLEIFEESKYMDADDQDLILSYQEAA